jgi:hypothetical protein
MVMAMLGVALRMTMKNMTTRVEADVPNDMYGDEEDVAPIGFPVK